MTNFTMAILLLTILIFEKVVVSTPSEINDFLPKNYDLHLNIVQDQDSHLERVHLKQETGFDGKVRSIQYFSTELDKNNTPVIKQKVQSVYTSIMDKSHHMDVAFPKNLRSQAEFLQNRVSPSLFLSSLNRSYLEKSKKIQEDQKEIKLPASSKLLRAKRSIEKEPLLTDFDDLQAEEAKVFRPLFVYRQQVSRRLKLQGTGKPSNNHLRIQQKKPYNNGIYSYRYPGYSFSQPIYSYNNRFRYYI